MAEMMQLADKDIKTAIINIYKCSRMQKHEHNEVINGRHKKAPNGISRYENEVFKINM